MFKVFLCTVLFFSGFTVLAGPEDSTYWRDNCGSSQLSKGDDGCWISSSHNGEKYLENTCTKEIKQIECDAIGCFLTHSEMEILALINKRKIAISDSEFEGCFPR